LKRGDRNLGVEVLGARLSKRSPRAESHEPYEDDCVKTH
jgi:hypothetical protein